MRHFVGSIVLASALAGWSLPASSQEARPERPYRGLFAGGNPTAEQAVIFGVSAGGGFSTGLTLGVADPESPGQLLRTDSRGFNSLSADLSYQLTRGRVSVRGGLGVSARYFPGLESPFLAATGATAALAYQLGARTAVNLEQGISYRPLHDLNLFSAAFEPPAGEYTAFDQSFGTVRDQRLGLMTSAGINHELSRRTSVSFGYSRQSNNGVDTDRTQTYESLGGRFSHGLSRNLSLRLGYGYAVGRFAEPVLGDRYGSHSIDGGIDFAKALSISRRTQIEFGTGTSVISDGITSRFHMGGSARLTREIGRTWAAGVAYDRSAQFLQVFRQPAFTDSVTASLSGMVNRRVEYRVATGWMTGALGLNAAASRGFNSYYAATGATVGLSRHLAIGAGYTYYHYRFDRAADLPAGAVTELSRHAVQAGLQISMPLYQRGSRSRSDNASR